MPALSVLLGKTDEIGQSSFWSFGEVERRHLEEKGVRFLTFGAQDTDLEIHSLENDFHFLETQLSTRQFKPDLALIITGGYGFLPEGIENASFPIFLLNIEWFLTSQHFYYQSQRTDQLLAVLETTKPYFKRMTGKATYVTSLPLLGDQFNQFYPIPDVEKIYDVSYVGTCNPLIHPERTKFLAQLATLPEKYKVLISQNLSKGSPDFHFESTNRVNNQSKICVNSSHPLVKAVGTRIAHTFFSGAFLLSDHLVDEKAFLKPGVHCDFYTDENLSEQIEYYLEQPDEREAMAKNGLQYAREGAFSFSSILIRFLDEVRKTPFEKLRSKGRFKNLSKAEQSMALGIEVLLSGLVSQEKGLKKGIDYLEQAFQLEPNNEAILNNLGAAYVFYFLTSRNASVTERERAHERGLELFQRVRELNPSDVFSRFNAAYLHYRNKDWKEIHKQFMELTELLEGDTKVSFSHIGLVVPGFFDIFSKRKWQELFFERFEDGKPTPKFYDGVREYMLWHLNTWMAEFHVECFRFAAAIEHYRNAALRFKDADQTFELLGWCLVKMKQFEEARDAFRHSLELNPLNVRSAGYLCDMLIALGDRKSALELAKKYALICQRISIFNFAVTHFLRIQEEGGTSEGNATSLSAIH